MFTGVNTGGVQFVELNSRLLRMCALARPGEVSEEDHPMFWNCSGVLPVAVNTTRRPINTA